LIILLPVSFQFTYFSPSARQTVEKINSIILGGVYKFLSILSYFLSIFITSFSAFFILGKDSLKDAFALSLTTLIFSFSI
jgi:isochorismate hydrolase